MSWRLAHPLPQLKSCEEAEVVRRAQPAGHARARGRRGERVRAHELARRGAPPPVVPALALAVGFVLALPLVITLALAVALALVLAFARGSEIATARR